MLQLAVTHAASALAQDVPFAAGKSTCALCTTARWASIPGKADAVACARDVGIGHPPGAQDCLDAPGLSREAWTAA